MYTLLYAFICFYTLLYVFIMLLYAFIFFHMLSYTFHMLSYAFHTLFICSHTLLYVFIMFFICFYRLFICFHKLFLCFHMQKSKSHLKNWTHTSIRLSRCAAGKNTHDTYNLGSFGFLCAKYGIPESVPVSLNCRNWGTYLEFSS